MDIRTEADDTTWCRVFETCSKLEVLVWRRHGAAQSRKIVTVPSLQSFTTHDVQNPPPIHAPNLAYLEVLDGGEPFSLLDFNTLVGTEAPSMKHLHLLANPTHNPDMEEMFLRCPNLSFLPVSTHQSRTSLYMAVAARAHEQVLFHDAPNLVAIEFASGPPSDPRAEIARERYQAPTQLAFSIRNNTVFFEPNATG
ncbi:hypothetical protein R3P38DRAFT_3225028 [Favolaschia claudopus]|uniref:Uncharacterized protein n=1 Tax=Favolaschia claudopus TaxID=2862362 RepID=A0AAV9ZUY4_9AGAR